MLENVLKECDTFLRNYAKMSEDDFWGNDTVRLAAAGISVAEKKPLDIGRIRMCRAMLKSREGLFSVLRSPASYVYCVKMAMSDDPELYLRHLSMVHQMLRRGWMDTGISVPAAMNIVDIVPPEQYTVIVERTLEIYRNMKDAHLFLTSEEDLAFAALMAMTWDSTADVHGKAERIYGTLYGELPVHANTLQTVSHILSLYDGDIVPMCRMVTELYRRLAEEDHSLGRDSTAVVLATFAASRSKIEDLVTGIAAADDYLHQFRPFRGIFGARGTLRRMIAVLCVQSAEDSADSGLSASIAASVTVSLVIRMMMAAAAAA